MADKYFPATKEGTGWQRAQYWLEKAVQLEADESLSEEQRSNRARMAFSMALKAEEDGDNLR